MRAPVLYIATGFERTLGSRCPANVDDVFLLAGATSGGNSPVEVADGGADGRGMPGKNDEEEEVCTRENDAPRRGWWGAVVDRSTAMRRKGEI